MATRPGQHQRPTTRGPYATIIDVARRAGVSQTTASRVLRGSGTRPATRVAVERAALELRYRRNEVAVSMRVRTTRSLGVLIDDLEDPIFPRIARAVAEVAEAAGYAILLGTARSGDLASVRDLDGMLTQRVDGLLVAAGQPSEALWRSLRASRVPMVAIYADRGALVIPQVGTDDTAGMVTAIGHLVDLGHRVIAYVRGPAGTRYDTTRLAGVLAAARAAGLGPAAVTIATGDGSPDGGELATRSLLAAGWAGTAIACYNDRTAMGVMRALQLAGRRVPEDVSVIGYDDILEAAWTSPPLTTVAQPVRATAGRAVRLLVEAIEAGGPTGEPSAVPEVVRLPPTLVVRSSTSAPRAEGASGSEQ